MFRPSTATLETSPLALNNSSTTFNERATSTQLFSLAQCGYAGCVRSKRSLTAQARAVSSVARSNRPSWKRVLPRTRLIRRRSFQRMFLDVWPASAPPSASVRFPLTGPDSMRGATRIGRARSIGPSHVAAYKARHFDDVLPHYRQAAARSGLGGPLAHPQQRHRSGVNLIDDGQGITGPLALAPIPTVCKAPSPPEQAVHRAADAFPTGVTGGLSCLQGTRSTQNRRMILLSMESS